MEKTNFTVARVATHTRAGVGKCERHNERKNESYGNINVDLERTPMNIHFKACGELTYNETLDRLVADAKEKGYITTMYGRRRPIPELASSNFMQRSFGERVAMNSPIQGTAADIIKIAMIRVWKKLRQAGFSSRLILQVHDELVIETRQEEVEQVRRILEESMKQAAQLAVPLEVDLHTGENWYEAH